MLNDFVVLNDVLDFDRLDSGRFSTVDMPYNLVGLGLSTYSSASNAAIFVSIKLSARYSFPSALLPTLEDCAFPSNSIIE